PSLPLHSLGALLSLLFNRHPDHRALHSFPTRRSSDLARGDAHRGAAESARCGPRWWSRRPGHEGASRRRLSCDDDARQDLFLARDRKSTRLNSSHVEISYAVFCLKKKKNNTNP